MDSSPLDNQSFMSMKFDDTESVHSKVFDKLNDSGPMSFKTNNTRNTNKTSHNVGIGNNSL